MAENGFWRICFPEEERFPARFLRKAGVFLSERKMFLPPEVPPLVILPLLRWLDHSSVDNRNVPPPRGKSVAQFRSPLAGDWREVKHRSFFFSRGPPPHPHGSCPLFVVACRRRAEAYFLSFFRQWRRSSLLSTFSLSLPVQEKRGFLRGWSSHFFPLQR